MKKIVVNSIMIIAAMLFAIRCDYVTNVKDPNAAVITGDRKVLVEDYTGHKCGNCPAAADTLKYLEKHSKYKGKIIPIAIHAGFFATTGGSYPTDLRNNVGNAYDTQFGISAAGNPNGLINRVSYGSATFIKAYSTWESEVVQMLNSAAKFTIKIKNDYDTSSKNLNTTITVRSLANVTGQYKLVVLLTEDSIIAEQLDYRLPSGSQLVSNYEFNHVLRDAINSTWGDPIFAGGAVVNDSIVKSYTGYSLNASYRSKKCHVVAYVYDANSSSPTYYEVLQAEEAHVEE